VPDILQGGNHVEQAKWKRQQSLIRTLHWRPELLEKANLSDKDKKFLESYVKSCEDQNQDKSAS
jgi:tRNA (guanine37-N1)-methyltransferase